MAHIYTNTFWWWDARAEDGLFETLLEDDGGVATLAFSPGSGTFMLPSLEIVFRVNNANMRLDIDFNTTVIFVKVRYIGGGGPSRTVDIDHIRIRYDPCLLPTVTASPTSSHTPSSTISRTFSASPTATPTIAGTFYILADTDIVVHAKSHSDGVGDGDIHIFDVGDGDLDADRHSHCNHHHDVDGHRHLHHFTHVHGDRHDQPDILPHGQLYSLTDCDGHCDHHPDLDPFADFHGHA